MVFHGPPNHQCQSAEGNTKEITTITSGFIIKIKDIIIIVTTTVMTTTTAIMCIIDYQLKVLITDF